MGKYSEPLEGEHAVCLIKTGKTIVYYISLNRRNRESWRMVGVGEYKLSISSEILDAKSISDSFVCILQYLHRLYWLSISNLAF